MMNYRWILYRQVQFSAEMCAENALSSTFRQNMPDLLLTPTDIFTLTVFGFPGNLKGTDTLQSF